MENYDKGIREHHIFPLCEGLLKQNMFQAIATRYDCSIVFARLPHGPGPLISTHTT